MNEFENLPAEEWIRRCQSDDVVAQEAFYDAYAHKATRWANYLDRQYAEDIVQEVFIDVFRSKSPFDGDRVEPWLKKITLNRAHRRRRPLKERMKSLFASPPEVSFERSDDPMAKRKLVDLFEAMSFEHRMVAVLIIVEEHTAPEVAAMLDIPEGTVRSRLKTARDALRKGIGPR